jgi:hypothetical protein
MIRHQLRLAPAAHDLQTPLQFAQCDPATITELAFLSMRSVNRMGRSLALDFDVGSSKFYWRVSQAVGVSSATRLTGKFDKPGSTEAR